MRLFILSVFCLLTMSAAAQQRYNSWFRTTVQIPIAGKWSADAELQYRRQSGFENSNPLAQPLLYSFRSRLYYQHSKGLRFAFSPVALFRANRIIRTDSDHLAEPTNEYRISGFLELNEPLHKKLLFHNREGVEYRFFDNEGNETRVRILNGIVYNPAKRWSVNAYHELLLNVAGVPTSQYLDQSRLAISCIYQVTKQLKVEPGYLYLSRLPSGNAGTVKEHNIVLNLTATF